MLTADRKRRQNLVVDLRRSSDLPCGGPWEWPSDGEKILSRKVGKPSDRFFIRKHLTCFPPLIEG